ncbi:sugar transferase [Dokdonia sinensis]|uniref:Sugar transferase n=1 Tax=Dokdonia sinensis TaxID=2479847 RepID=A0A3M0GFG0_9FLAO|nr:sugar transferase [Dokdonia sinensis]RMB63831.1 sugar transferase [Dokdonia sinensis]
MYSSFVKPFFDFVFALVALVIVAPIMVVLFVLITLLMKSTPIFKQQRSGKKDRLFYILKFKSMTEARDENGELLPDEERLTGFGKFLRKSSLDELPQLFNILKGEMSFVGPRPLPPQYLALYNEVHARRSNVKPGISGWAQVNGRNSITWNKKFDLDIWYLDHQSFWLDIKIVLKTVWIVCSSSGVNTEGVATTIPYDGKN